MCLRSARCCEIARRVPRQIGIRNLQMTDTTKRTPLPDPDPTRDGHEVAAAMMLGQITMRLLDRLVAQGKLTRAADQRQTRGLHLGRSLAFLCGGYE